MTIAILIVVRKIERILAFDYVSTHNLLVKQHV